MTMLRTFYFNLLKYRYCIYICINMLTPLPVDQRAQGGLFTFNGL